MADEYGRDFLAAAEVLNEAGDKGLRNEVYADFRKAARPLGEKVIAQGAAAMPKRGGLSAILAKAKMSQSNSTTGRNPAVALSFRTNPSHALKAMNDGDVRHPAWPRPGVKRVWRVTKVEPGAYSRPFEAGRDDVAKEIVDGLNRVAQEIARKTNGRP